MTYMTEEAVEEVLDDYKDRVLKYIALERYSENSRKYRGRIASATSLRMLCKEVEAFLEAIQPTSSGEPTSKTASLGEYRVVEKNLTRELIEIDRVLANTIYLEDDYE